MANLYGVANPVPSLFFGTTIGAVDVACPAGAETNIISIGPFGTNVPGVYYPVAWVQIGIFCGATAPNPLVLGFRVNNGADQGTYTVNPYLLIPNQTGVCVWFTYGQNSGTLWAPPGSTLQISINPTAQAVTCTHLYTQGLFGIFRGPDQ